MMDFISIWQLSLLLCKFSLIVYVLYFFIFFCFKIRGFVFAPFIGVMIDRRGFIFSFSLVNLLGKKFEKKKLKN